MREQPWLPVCPKCHSTKCQCDMEPKYAKTADKFSVNQLLQALKDKGFDLRSVYLPEPDERVSKDSVASQL